MVLSQIAMHRSGDCCIAMPERKDGDGNGDAGGPVGFPDDHFVKPLVLGVPPLVKNQAIRPCQALDSVDVPNIRQATVATSGMMFLSIGYTMGFPVVKISIGYISENGHVMDK